MGEVVSRFARLNLQAQEKRMQKAKSTLPELERRKVDAALKGMRDPHDRIAVGWNLIESYQKRIRQTEDDKKREEEARKSRISAYLAR